MNRLCMFAVVSWSCGSGAAAPPSPAPAPADVRFISGMIPHHQQAVIMANWALDTARQASRAVRTLAERIRVSQEDEIAFMERWLRERDRALAHHGMLMPGMLTPVQMARLDAARGAEFDWLFVTLMIQHHEGAIAMVDQLLSAQGAAQDELVFQFAADVHADQTAEIERMRGLLATLLTGGPTQ